MSRRSFYGSSFLTVILEETKTKSKTKSIKDLHQAYFREPLNPAFYWKHGFDRWLISGNKRVYMVDHQLYSNYISESAKTLKDWKFIGPLSLIPTGQVLNFLDYRFMMTTVRYLNKSFLVLTQSHCKYIPDMKREAVLKASLHEIYTGEYRMPILRHPYYTNCNKLKILYQKCEKQDSLCMSKLNYDKMFMIDLFSVDTLFPEMKKLKVVVSHSHQ